RLVIGPLDPVVAPAHCEPNLKQIANGNLHFSWFIVRLFCFMLLSYFPAVSFWIRWRAEGLTRFVTSFMQPKSLTQNLGMCQEEWSEEAKVQKTLTSGWMRTNHLQKR
ncbi:hypothetical protein chiPu_0024745, partial [Chiloscyllium punctatum]|nr:hypothetical protein [Chiloscyllium punctatum]